MTPQTERAAATTPSGNRDILGHPRGLAVLFATEAWERFSYFGNAALVVLYMTKYLLDPDRVGLPISRRFWAGSSPTACWVSIAPWSSAAYSWQSAIS